MAVDSHSWGLLGALSTFLGLYLRKIDVSEKNPARFGIINVLLGLKGLRMGSVVTSLFY